MRTRLEETRKGIIKKFRVGPQKGYLNVGFFPDGKPGEVFIKLDKSVANGWTQTTGILLSLCLQHGVSVDVIADKLSFHQFEPRGLTGDPEIPIATSIPDYIGRYLKLHYGTKEKKKNGNPNP